MIDIIIAIIENNDLDFVINNDRILRDFHDLNDAQIYETRFISIMDCCYDWTMDSSIFSIMSQTMIGYWGIAMT